MSHHKALVSSLKYSKLQVFQILNLSVSNCLLGSFANRHKIWARVSSRSVVCLQRGTVIHTLSKHKGLKNIGHSMRMVQDTRKCIFGSKQWLLFHIWSIMTLYYKIQHILSHNVAVVLLRNVYNKKFLENV